MTPTNETDSMRRTQSFSRTRVRPNAHHRSYSSPPLALRGPADAVQLTGRPSSGHVMTWTRNGRASGAPTVAQLAAVLASRPRRRAWRSGVPIIVDRDQAQRLVEAGAQLVEVLPEHEYAEEHLPGALHLPLKRLDAGTARALLDASQPVIVHRRDALCDMSPRAAWRLNASGSDPCTTTPPESSTGWPPVSPRSAPTPRNVE
jgi:rhodanese-related sulfurtransferase